MITALEMLSGVEATLPIIITITIIALVYVALGAIIGLSKKRLLEKAKTKKQVTNIELFSKMLKYLVILFLIIFAISSYSGSWASLGIGIGLLSAAIGFALQKPITGIAAWIMIITKRPFQIGDRIVIGKLKGDVRDITLTHLYLNEVGGIINAEQTSGRMILIPNSILFEENIINYSTQKEEIILDEVVSSVTYESNLDKAIEIALEAAKKQVGDFTKKPKHEPYVRVFFQASGINVHARYFVPLKKMQKSSSNITKEIHDQIIKSKDVDFAYPHTEFILKDKNSSERWKHHPLTNNKDL